MAALNVSARVLVDFAVHRNDDIGSARVCGSTSASNAAANPGTDMGPGRRDGTTRPTAHPDWAADLLRHVLIVGHMGLGPLAAYAFACLRFPGCNVIFFTLMALLMIPRQLFLLPQFDIVQWLGWTNSSLGLAAPHFVGVLAVFLLRQFFLALPMALTEATKLDGAGLIRTYFSVLLPLAKPGLIAATILVLIYSWNDHLWPLIIINDGGKTPLTAGLATLQGELSTDQPVIMAGAALASLPIILASLSLQRHFIDCIAFSGGK